MGKIAQWFGFETRSEVPPEQPPLVIPSRSLTLDSDPLNTINVYRAVQLMGVGVSQLTLDAWRGEKPLDPKPSIIRKPDIGLSLSSFLKLNVSSLALTGNAYWRLSRNDRGEVTNVSVLDPWLCEPHTDGTLSVGGVEKRLQPNEFRHLGLLRIPGRAKALGPIQAARVELNGASEVTRYGSEWFNSGDVPSGTLKTDQVLSPEQAKTYGDQWAARDKHSVAVLGHGLDYAPVLLSPEDAQFIETRKFDTTAIARLFGIPARLFLAVVEGGSSTYANIAQDDLSFVRWTLMDYLREIEEAFSATLPGAQTVRFNLDALIRPDTKSRYEAHKLGIDGGWLTVEDVKKIEGLA